MNPLIGPFKPKGLVSSKRSSAPGFSGGSISIVLAAPGPPLSLVLSLPTTSSLTLSWSPPVSDGGSPITSYNVYFKRTSDFFYSQFGQTASLNTVIIGLDPSTSYDFKVTATNAIGTGPFSDPVTGSTTGGAAGSGLFGKMFGKMFGRMMGNTN